MLFRKGEGGGKRFLAQTGAQLQQVLVQNGALPEPPGGLQDPLRAGRGGRRVLPQDLLLGAAGLPQLFPDLLQIGAVARLPQPFPLLFLP